MFVLWAWDQMLETSRQLIITRTMFVKATSVSINSADFNYQECLDRRRNSFVVLRETKQKLWFADLCEMERGTWDLHQDFKRKKNKPNLPFGKHFSNLFSCPLMPVTLFTYLHECHDFLTNVLTASVATVSWFPLLTPSLFFFISVQDVSFLSG